MLTVRLREKVRGAPRRSALVALVAAGAIVLVGPTLASALPGNAGGQPPPGAPAVEVDPSTIQQGDPQPPAGAPAVEVDPSTIQRGPAQPVNTDPQRPGPPVQKPSDEKPGVSSGPDLGTGVSSPPE